MVAETRNHPQPINAVPPARERCCRTPSSYAQQHRLEDDRKERELSKSFTSCPVFHTLYSSIKYRVQSVFDDPWLGAENTTTGVVPVMG